jgi:hypothetical protein
VTPRMRRWTFGLALALAFLPPLWGPLGRALAQPPAAPIVAAPEEKAPETQPLEPAPAEGAMQAELESRVKSFYAGLRGKRVNIYSLYQNENFRGFFTTEQVLQNYIAYLTSRLGEHRFRKYRVEDAEIQAITPTGPDRARVKVKLIGRHRQAFLFWLDNTAKLEDNWRRIQGEWFVFPPPF